MSYKRPVKQTPPQITAVADTLQDLAESLRAVADNIKALGFSELGVTNHGQLRDGMKFIEKYASAARAALREARAERGDYGTPGKSKTVSDSKNDAPKKGSKSNHP